MPGRDGSYTIDTSLSADGEALAEAEVWGLFRCFVDLCGMPLCCLGAPCWLGEFLQSANICPTNVEADPKTARVSDIRRFEASDLESLPIS